MSLYCRPCRQELALGSVSCPVCGGQDLACMTCHQSVGQGQAICSACSRIGVRRVLPPDVEQAIAEVPDVVLNLPRVPEVYQAGRHGVRAEVRISPGDAAIMNELLRLVPMLHGMAGRLNQFQGHTDHTRKLIRDMRTLACDVQEEVELRRGPG